jgi:hypothetical protein
LPHDDPAAFGRLFAEQNMTEDNDGAAAPADVPTTPSAPAESEQATPTDTSVAPQADAVAENAEPKAEETAEGEESEPKRLSRNQRLQRKAARLSTVVAEQAAELERLRQATAKADTESEPKEAEYNGDWTKYQADYAAWKATQNIRNVLDEREQRERASRLQERIQEAAEEFQERAEALKAVIPDFDKTVEGFSNSGGKFAPHVREELLESDKGPMLAYHIAKNPALAAELNAMSPRDLAREIGRLEKTVVLPERKTITKAPAPLAALRGGAAPSQDVHTLAKSDDVSAYVAARNAAEKKNARA